VKKNQPKKRGNNEGLVRQRSDGRWEARLSLPNGKSKSFYGKTQREVMLKLAEARRELEQGASPDFLGDKQTLEQYLLSWLDTIKHTVRPSTWRFYHDYVRLHIVPTLGKVLLTKLTAQQIQALYAKKLAEGLSATSVHHMHSTLHRALNKALRLGLVHRNVADLAESPPLKRHTYTTFTPDEARRFLDAIVGDRLEALYVLAITTGMRRGELLALRWRDVDFTQGVLHINATLQYVQGSAVFAEPKTDYSRRQVALTVIAIDALQAHRARQGDERAACPEWDASFDLVFPNTIGKPINPSNLVNREFSPLLKRLDLPHIRFHDLRHTSATLMLKAGVPAKVVSEMLGHSHVSITLGVYSHVTPDMQQDAALAMNRLLTVTN
jgi:integrase